MKNYLDEIYTLSEFKRDNPALAEQAERAKQYLKGYCPNSDNATFVVIEVEGYKCVAYLLEDLKPLCDEFCGDGNIPKTEEGDKLLLRACIKGKPVQNGSLIEVCGKSYEVKT